MHSVSHKSFLVPSKCRTNTFGISSLNTEMIYIAQRLPQIQSRTYKIPVIGWLIQPPTSLSLFRCRGAREVARIIVRGWKKTCQLERASRVEGKSPRAILICGRSKTMNLERSFVMLGHDFRKRKGIWSCDWSGSDAFCPPYFSGVWFPRPTNLGQNIIMEYVSALFANNFDLCGSLRSILQCYCRYWIALGLGCASIVADWTALHDR